MHSLSLRHQIHACYALNKSMHEMGPGRASGNLAKGTAGAWPAAQAIDVDDEGSDRQHERHLPVQLKNCGVKVLLYAWHAKCTTSLQSMVFHSKQVQESGVPRYQWRHHERLTQQGSPGLAQTSARRHIGTHPHSSPAHMQVLTCSYLHILQDMLAKTEHCARARWKVYVSPCSCG